MTDHTIHQKPFAHIKNLNKRMMLVDLLINGLILHFVKVNTLNEIVDGIVAVDIFVVGRVDFDLFYVRFDDLGIVAHRFNEEEAKAKVFGAIVADEFAAFTRCVCRVEDDDFSFVVEPRAHVFEGFFGAHVANFNAFQVARIEEFLIGVEFVEDGSAPVFAHIEGLGLDTDPVQVAS
jgi:hypothetical protein